MSDTCKSLRNFQIVAFVGSGAAGISAWVRKQLLTMLTMLTMFPTIVRF
jgi:hypothetical protein